MLSVGQFLDIEKELDLYSLQTNGCQFWNYFRFIVYSSLHTNVKVKNESHKTSANRCRDLIFSLLHLPRLRKADVCIMCDPRRIKENGFYTCMYTGDLAKTFAAPIELEQLYEPKHFRPVAGKSPIYLDAWYFPRGFIKRIGRKLCTHKYQKVEAEIRAKLAPLYAKLEKRNAIPLEWDWCIQTITLFVFTYPIIYRMLQILLKRISPKIIIEVCYYSPDSMLVNEVAKDLEIPVVELQHGIMGAEHVAYNFVPGIAIKQFPDYLMTFSEFWSLSAKFPIPPERVIATGFPYLERRVAQYLPKPQKASAPRTILFLSSPMSGDELINTAIALSARFSREELRIIYKLHPNEYENWRILYPQLVNSEIEVVAQRDIDVYACFAQADVQIGLSSTAIYEGLAFGLSTYILRTASFDRNIGAIKDLCLRGYATAFSSPEELIALLWKEPQALDGNVFWKPNALENMHAAIRKIMSQRHQ